MCIITISRYDPLRNQCDQVHKTTIDIKKTYSGIILRKIELKNTNFRTKKNKPNLLDKNLPNLEIFQNRT